MKRKTRPGGGNRSFGLDGPWATGSPLPAQLLACDRVDRAAVGAPLELRYDAPHHGANVSRATCNCRANRGTDLGIIDLRWKIPLERRELGAFLRDEVLALRREIQLDRLTSPLDGFPD